MIGPPGRSAPSPAATDTPECSVERVASTEQRRLLRLRGHPRERDGQPRERVEHARDGADVVGHEVRRDEGPHRDRRAPCARCTTPRSPRAARAPGRTGAQWQVTLPCRDRFRPCRRVAVSGGVLCCCHDRSDGGGLSSPRGGSSGPPGRGATRGRRPATPVSVVRPASGTRSGRP